MGCETRFEEDEPTHCTWQTLFKVNFSCLWLLFASLVECLLRTGNVIS